MDSTSFTYPQRMKIVSGSIMTAIDRQSVHDRGIPATVLMQNAGESVAKDLIRRFPSSLQSPLIFCGKGNNGGDGFVIADYLSRRGSMAAIVLLCPEDEIKGDALVHFSHAKKNGVPILVCNSPDTLKDSIQFHKPTLFIDALLGTGSRGAPRGLFHEAVMLINTFANITPILAIDISSGVNADNGAVEGSAVKADRVYTMGLPKVGHACFPGLNYYRDISVLNIGFPNDLLDQAESEADWITPQQVNAWIPKREVSAHKGTEGHLLVIAGSKKMPGAAMMCVKASVLTGAGLVTLACPQSIYLTATQSIWEKMTLPLQETAEGSIHKDAFQQIFQEDFPYTAAVIGPGLSRHPSTLEFVNHVAESFEIPLLIDGDGLSALSINTLKKRNKPWVITPHPGEMARLFHTSPHEIQLNRWKYAKDAVSRSVGVCVLKGPKTVVSCKDHVLYINPTGNPAMASGGMGDALAGTIGALLAKRLSPLHAAAGGAFLHGLAADLCVKKTHAEAVCATEVSAQIQSALAQIRKTAAFTAA